MSSCVFDVARGVDEIAEAMVVPPHTCEFYCPYLKHRPRSECDNLRARRRVISPRKTRLEVSNELKDNAEYSRENSAECRGK